MEKTVNNTEQSAETKIEPRKHSLAARLLVAYGMSGIGAKLLFLGIPLDANAVFEGQKLTLKEKFSREKFKQALEEKLQLETLRSLTGQKDTGLGLEKLKQLAIKSNPSTSAQIKAQLKSFIKLTKFSTGLGVIGTVIGAIIGWKRGGLIEDWHDTVKHPIDSTKVILGFAKPEILDKYRTNKKEPEKKQAVDTTETSKQENSKSWANEIKAKPASKADGILSARNEAATSLSLG